MIKQALLVIDGTSFRLINFTTSLEIKVFDNADVVKEIEQIIGVTIKESKNASSEESKS